MQPSHEARNHDIESLRAYAIAITFVAHLYILQPAWAGWVGFFWLGGGVDLFFCISGFVITSSLARQRKLAPADPFLPFASLFWIRRVFRLWPAALFWSAATLILSLSFNTSGAFGRPAELVATWAAALFQLVNLQIVSCAYFHVSQCDGNVLWHYWSLSLEEQFYFVFPFAFFFLGGRLVSLAVAGALLQTFLYRPWPSPLWFFRTDSILLGIAVALLWQQGHIKAASLRQLDRRLVHIPLVAVLGFALVAVAHPMVASFYMGLTGLIACALVFIASLDRGYVAQGGPWRAITAYIGTRSYSIYLVHMPVLALVRELASRLVPVGIASTALDVGLLLAALLLVLQLAEFSYRYIEYPLRIRGRGIADNLRQHRPAAPFAEAGYTNRL